MFAVQSKTAPRIIVRPASPERLDAMLRVNTSLSWLVLGVLLAMVAGALVWSFAGTAPVKVGGRGMLLSSLGITDIPATATGKVVRIAVRVGDRVQRGDAVAELSQPDADDRLRSRRLDLASYRDELSKLAAFQADTGAALRKVAEERRRGLEARLTALRARVAAMQEMERNTRSLVEKGYSVQSRMLDVTNERTRAEDDYAQTANALTQLDSDAENQRTQNARETLAIQMKIAAAEREAEVARDVLARTTAVTAPSDGVIVEASANVNEIVPAGSALFRMLPRAEAGDGLVGTIYVSSADGKRVRPGMAVQIIPANVRLQREGFVEGRVLQVADLPATRESMQRILKNGSLIDQLTANGPPYEVSVALDADRSTPSGLRWSTGTGTPRPLESGTITDAKLVVDEIPLIALVVPRAETLLTWGRSVGAAVSGRMRAALSGGATGAESAAPSREAGR